MSAARVAPPLEPCGAISSPPFAAPTTSESKACASPEQRRYKPKYATLAHHVLDVESEVCGVPDSAYQLLDNLLEQSEALVPTQRAASVSREYLVGVARGIAKLLTRNGYALHVPVRRLADAFVNHTQSEETPATYLFDCDTGSFLYLSIAEHLGLEASLVETTLASGNSHAYVRWGSGGTFVDWDVNGQTECRTSDKQYPEQGVAMSDDAVMSYVYGLRGSDWKDRKEYARARADFDKARALAPKHPAPMNFMAWLIATTPSLQTEDAKGEAIHLALMAVDTWRTPSHLDTLACALAAGGSFSLALAVEEEAIRGAAGSSLRDYQARYELIQQHKTCAGQR